MNVSYNATAEPVNDFKTVGSWIYCTISSSSDVPESGVLRSLPGSRSFVLGLLSAASCVVVPGIGVRVTIRGLLIHTSFRGVARRGVPRVKLSGRAA